MHNYPNIITLLDLITLIEFFISIFYKNNFYRLIFNKQVYKYC